MIGGPPLYIIYSCCGLLCPMSITLHLVDQSSRLVRSSCSALWSSKVVTRLYNLVSSANKCTEDSTTLGMSLMKQTNRSRPNTLPWGMPLVTLTHVDLLPFTTTLWRRPERNASIHCSTAPPTPYPFSFTRSLWCGTESNAFPKSMYKASRLSPSSRALVQSSKTVNSCAKHDRPGTKPCWTSFSRWLLSMCSIIAFLASLSNILQGIDVRLTDR